MVWVRVCVRLRVFVPSCLVLWLYVPSCLVAIWAWCYLVLWLFGLGARRHVSLPACLGAIWSNTKE